VGSLRYRSFRFVVYSNDHLPRHVHAFFEDAEVIIDLRDNRTVAIADRANAYSPKNLKKIKLKKVLRAAASNFDGLVALWEEIHGR
jgi:Domain of unknown function (DUF4160)